MIYGSSTSSVLSFVISNYSKGKIAYRLCLVRDA